jgi:hypothetical protein
MHHPIDRGARIQTPAMRPPVPKPGPGATFEGARVLAATSAHSAHISAVPASPTAPGQGGGSHIDGHLKLII